MRKPTPNSYVPVYSKLVFISETVKPSGNWYKGEKQYLRKALYRCECGSVVERTINNVKRGVTRSCGCISLDFPSAETHGMYANPLYHTWNGIKERCYNKKSTGYKIYGGRGVLMCEEWYNYPDKFMKWAMDNGWKKGMQIDKDIKANAIGIKGLIYSPEWCTVVTAKINNNNRRDNVFIDYNGKKQTIAQWAEECGIKTSTFRYRLRAAWSMGSIISIPPSSSNSGRNKKIIKCK